MPPIVARPTLAFDEWALQTYQVWTFTNMMDHALVGLVHHVRKFASTSAGQDLSRNDHSFTPLRGLAGTTGMQPRLGGSFSFTMMALILASRRMSAASFASMISREVFSLTASPL